MRLFLHYKGKSQAIPNIQSYASIASFVKEKYPNIAEWTLTYLDSDGDKINLSCNQDLQVMFETIEKNYVKIFLEDQSDISTYNVELENELLKLSSKKSKEAQVPVKTQEIEVKKEKKMVEHQAKCSECRVQSIVGIRYKCLKCQNFDLCEKCQVNTQHSHNMLKMRLPEENSQKEKLQTIKNEIQEVKGVKEIDAIKRNRCVLALKKLFGESKIPEYINFFNQNYELTIEEVVEKYTAKECYLKLESFLKSISEIFGYKNQEKYKKFFFKNQRLNLPELVEKYIVYEL